MGRALKTDMPGPDWRVEVGPSSPTRPIEWRALFRPELPTPRRLVVEIGFGRGEFLMELACNEPDTAFLGVEASFKRHLKMARRLGRTELQNIRLVLAPAAQLIARLPERSVSGCWINYPDPWPKKRHQRRRLINPSFVRDLTGVLEPEGVVQIATDHREYAEAIDAVLGAEGRLENLYAPARFRPEVGGRMPTAYELLWRAEGRALHYFAYRAPARRPAATRERS